MSRGSDHPPRIQTKRLTLDAHRLEDLESLYEMWADPRVVQHITGRPSTELECWNRLLRYRGLWPVLGYGYWAVRETSSGRFAGEIGFADFRREITPSIIGIPEAGWVFASWAHGQGFANEALRAAVQWLDHVVASPRSVCLITSENRVSRHIAEKNGFARIAETRLMGSDCLMFERRRRITRNQFDRTGQP